MALSFREKMANDFLGTPVHGTPLTLQEYLNTKPEQTGILNQLALGSGNSNGFGTIGSAANDYIMGSGNTGSAITNAINGTDTGSPISNAINNYVNNGESSFASKSISNKPKLGSFINDFTTGARENYNEGFSPNNFGQKKNWATRIGEGFGSLARFADSPLGRGLIAYGLSNYAGDTNPLEQAITAGVGRQQNRMQDQLYRQRLKDMGYTQNELDSIGGNITDDVYKNLANSYKLNNSVKWGDLAEFNPEIKKAIEANPELADTFAPSSVVNQILRMGLTNAQIANLIANAQYTSGAKTDETEAKTGKLKAETGQVGKPRVSINIKQGGTKSIIEHRGGSGGSSNKPTRPTKTQYTQAQILAEMKRRGLIK